MSENKIIDPAGNELSTDPNQEQLKKVFEALNSAYAGLQYIKIDQVDASVGADRQHDELKMAGYKLRESLVYVNQYVAMRNVGKEHIAAKEAEDNKEAIVGANEANK